MRFAPDRCQFAPAHKARHNIWKTVRSECAFSKKKARCCAAPSFCSSAPRRWATIEFLQQEWINDGNFIEIGNERDPVIGLQEEGASFTIPEAPVRRRVHGIETFNVLRGGEYFFMPSISRLKWLADPGNYG